MRTLIKLCIHMLASVILFFIISTLVEKCAERLIQAK
jgi:hypothetical protein